MCEIVHERGNTNGNTYAVHIKQKYLTFETKLEAKNSKLFTETLLEEPIYVLVNNGIGKETKK